MESWKKENGKRCLNIVGPTETFLVSVVKEEGKEKKKEFGNENKKERRMRWSGKEKKEGKNGNGRKLKEQMEKRDGFIRFNENTRQGLNVSTKKATIRSIFNL